MNPTLLHKPLVTEKAMANVSKHYYGFLVDTKATKSQIKAAVEKLFGVTVVGIKTTMNPGKTKRVGKKRTTIITETTKKDFVKLANGQTLDIVPTMNVEEGKK